jgi:hypothetical protein
VTLWEAFYILGPKLATERIFGSRVYVTYPLEHRRKSLLLARRWIGYFVGFETEAVLRIWALEKNRVVRVTAPRINDGHRQGDVHDGETFRDRVPVDNTIEDGLSSDHDEDSDASEFSPYFARVGPEVSSHFPRTDRNTKRPSGGDSGDQISPRPESPSETQNLQSSVLFDSEPEDNRDEIPETGPTYQASTEADVNYNTWDGDHVYHTWHKTKPTGSYVSSIGYLNVERQ